MDKDLLKEKARFHLLAKAKEDIDGKLLEGLGDFALAYGDSATDERLYASDVVVLFSRDRAWGEKTAKAIRGRLDLFLKPLMLFSGQAHDGVTDIVDDVITLPASPVTVRPKIERALAISQKVNGLRSIPEGATEDRLKEIALLRFLYSRETYLLKPIRNICSCVGYSYPLVQLLLDVAPGKEGELLDRFLDARLLEGKPLDRVNLCPFCGYFQINFREECPSCHSLKVTEEATIHHYRCAYVGRERDFKNGLSLKCPKCGKEVRHIGVDYDKPAEDLWCDDCGKSFAEPAVRCLCIQCARAFSPQDTVTRLIREFSLAQEGFHAAEEGVVPGVGLADILRTEVGFYKIDVFKELLRLESLRCKRFSFKSSLLRVSVRNFNEIINEEGLARAQKLRREVASIFKDELRNTDMLTYLSDNELLVILTGTSSDKAGIAMERVKNKIGSLFKRALNFEYKVLGLEGEPEDVETILDKIQ